jgi:chaperonin GroES
VQSVITLPIDPNADPNRPRLDEALEVVEDAISTPLSAVEKLMQMAAMSGDISATLSGEELSDIGEKVVTTYERDKADRKDWEDTAREALAACSQEEVGKAGEKEFPWVGASNMKWPLLTIAAMQFNARMYPAIVKGDEAVLCKVIGQDNGQIASAPNPVSGVEQPVPAVDPSTGQIALDAQGMPQPHWLVKPGAKAKRARRVSEYLNTTLFYRMDNWEDDTDALLMQLPATGCVFRKQWSDENGRPQSATVSALNLIVPMKSRNLATALRITEELEDVYPHEIAERQRVGFYRDIDLDGTDAVTPGKDRRAVSTEDDGARLLLEQQCLWDFDEDGLDEPYIVTVDHKTRKVLRIEPNFSDADIEWRDMPNGERRAIRIKRRAFYVKYGMFPHPAGKFYDIGLGHLLKRLGDGIDTMLNQLIDAGTAAVAGGGFIGSGVRLQARGKGGVVRMTPGEYRTVDVSGDTLRAAIVERTLPNVSPVTFQLLELILGAARDIAGIKDVMTGEASNQGQVGTTLALIEQGLQVFNATAKRIFRSLKAEFELLRANLHDFGGELIAKDYLKVLDDTEADFAADFSSDDLDIRPVSDPASITRMQKMAQSQYLKSLLPDIQATGGDAKEVMHRVLEAADVEDIDKIYPPPPPPDPMQAQLSQEQIMQQIRGLAAKADKDEASAQASQAKALRDAAEAAIARFNLSIAAGEHGVELGVAAANLEDPAQ